MANDGATQNYVRLTSGQRRQMKHSRSLMSRTRLKNCLAVLIVALISLEGLEASGPSISVRQITFGPENHFFGYIGHVQNIPWNGSGRYILALQTTFTNAWNPQQGTMFYWNPESLETQFFFNDRDPKTGKVFCVLFDISKGPHGQRVREYRFEDTPIGNSGVAQNGGYFLGINYGRLDRLRRVTGYRDAFDWTAGVKHPDDDGVFKVNIATGEKNLLVSFRELAGALRPTHPTVDQTALFINHTLWNREDDRIFFFARGAWGSGSKRENRINQSFIIKPDGSGLTRQKQHIGGHPEWDYGRRIIGRVDDRQVIYDVDRQLVVGALGNPDIFPNPEGDIALSPDGKWFVNGYKNSAIGKNFYVLYRRSDGAYIRSSGFDIGTLSGDLRQDPSPCWNREGTQVLVPGLADDSTRQLFIIELAK